MGAIIIITVIIVIILWGGPLQGSGDLTIWSEFHKVVRTKTSLFPVWVHELWESGEAALGQTDIACKKSNLVWIFEQMLHCRQICRTVNTSRIFKRQLLNIGQFLHEGAQKVPSQMPQQCWYKQAEQQTLYTIQQGFSHPLMNRIGCWTVGNTGCLAAVNQVWVQVPTAWLCRSWDTTFFFPSLCL